MDDAAWARTQIDEFLVAVCALAYLRHPSAQWRPHLPIGWAAKLAVSSISLKVSIRTP